MINYRIKLNKLIFSGNIKEVLFKPYNNDFLLKLSSNSIYNEEVNNTITRFLYTKINNYYKDSNGDLSVDSFYYNFYDYFRINFSIERILFYINIRNVYLTEVEIYVIFSVLAEKNLINTFLNYDNENYILIKRLQVLDYDDDFDVLLEMFLYCEEFGYLGNKEVILNFLRNINIILFNGNLKDKPKLLSSTPYTYNYNIMVQSNKQIFENDIQLYNKDNNNNSREKVGEFFYKFNKPYFNQLILRDKPKVITNILEFIKDYYKNLSINYFIRKSDIITEYEFNNFELNFANVFDYFDLNDALLYIDIFYKYIIKDNLNTLEDYNIIREKDPIYKILNSEKLTKLDNIFTEHIELLTIYQIIDIIYIFAKGEIETSNFINELCLELYIKKIQFKKEEYFLIVKLIWSLSKIYHNNNVESNYCCYKLIDYLITNYFNYSSQFKLLDRNDFIILLNSLYSINYYNKNFYIKINNTLVNHFELDTSATFIAIKSQITNNVVDNNILNILYDDKHLFDIEVLFLKHEPKDILIYYYLLLQLLANNNNDLNSKINKIIDKKIIKYANIYFKSELNTSEKNLDIIDKFNIAVILLYTLYSKIRVTIDSDIVNNYISYLKSLNNNLQRNYEKISLEQSFIIYQLLGNINLILFDNDYFSVTRASYYNIFIKKINEEYNFENIFKILELGYLNNYKNDINLSDIVELKFIQYLEDLSIKEIFYFTILNLIHNNNFDKEILYLVINRVENIFESESIDINYQYYYSFYKYIYRLYYNSDNCKLFKSNEQAYELIRINNQLDTDLSYKENIFYNYFNLFEMNNMFEILKSNMHKNKSNVFNKDVIIYYINHNTRMGHYNITNNSN